MQNWLKRSLLVVGVFGLCWIGAVWYWRTTTRMPDTGDLALAMLVMPLTLVTGYWLARKTFGAGAAQAPAAAPGSPAQDAKTADAGGAAPAPEAALPWQPLAVGGTALRMPQGSSTAELAAAFAEGQARLDLDPELTDMHGFPLLAGRVAGVDLAALEEWLANQKPAPRAQAGQHLRAMALGGEVAAELAQQASSVNGEGVLQLVPLVPSDWPEATQELALQWLKHCAADAGWPEDRLALRRPSATATPLAALRAVSALAGVAAPQPTLSMLLAFDSSIDPDAVERLAVDGKLYGPRNPNGRMPAEGAAGILLVPPADAEDDVLLLALEAAAPGEDGRLPELAKAALAPADGALPVYVAADTDHRAVAMSELMQCVEAAAPELDTGAALACIGAACGRTGAAAALAAVALAHQQALEGSGFALALANSDPTQRFALLVGPLPAPASKAPSLS